MIVPGSVDISARLIKHSPQIEAFIQAPDRASYDGFDIQHHFLPRLAFGAQLFVLSTAQAAALAVVSACEVGQTFPGLVLHVGSMSTLSIVEGTNTMGFTGEMFDCTAWLQDAIDTEGGSEVIEDAIALEMASHLSFEQYVDNVRRSVRHLLRRYDAAFSCAPKGVFILGSVGPSLLRVGRNQLGPTPHLKRVALGEDGPWVMVPGSDADAMHLEAAGCMLYTDQDNRVARQLFKKRMNVFELE